MIDNTAKIRELLKFPDKNSFYFLEILQRRKENPDLEKHAKLIRDFFIYSLEDFDEIVPRAIELCDQYNARAYFRLNLRDAKNIALQYNRALSEILTTSDYKAIPRLYSRVVGQYQSDTDKTWVVDVDFDEDEGSVAGKVLGYIKELREDAIVAVLPTKNGIHFISRPFRLDKFKQEFPRVDVHKDNPTILYMP